MVQGRDGRVWLLTDVWPGSVTLHAGLHRPVPGCSGYLDADGDGEAELVLYRNRGERTERDGEPLPDWRGRMAWWTYRPEEYCCYVGAMGPDGYAPVYAKGVGPASEPCGYLDPWFYLYDEDRQPVTCGKLAASDHDRIFTVQPPAVTGEQIHANVFFYNSPLRVWPASYLWLISSADRGRTWSAPRILNPQVRGDESEDIWFCGAGPGRGLAASDGRIYFPCYTQTVGGAEMSSFVISSEDGRRWRRSQSVPARSSEAALAEVSGRIYLFARYGQVCTSPDHGVTWYPITGWPDGLFRDCQLSAIVYSRLIGGRTAILLSGPGGDGRVNGKIWVGFAEKTGDGGQEERIRWEYVYEVTAGGEGFAYSCLTELSDGTIGLLYERGDGTMAFRRLSLDEILGRKME